MPPYRASPLTGEIIRQEMWRQETGMIEMLFTYISDYQSFSGWSSWKGVLEDILSSHEIIRRQRLLLATANTSFMPPEAVKMDELMRVGESDSNGDFTIDLQPVGMADCPLQIDVDPEIKAEPIELPPDAPSYRKEREVDVEAHEPCSEGEVEEVDGTDPVIVQAENDEPSARVKQEADIKVEPNSESNALGAWAIISNSQDTAANAAGDVAGTSAAANESSKLKDDEDDGQISDASTVPAVSSLSDELNWLDSPPLIPSNSSNTPPVSVVKELFHVNVPPRVTRKYRRVDNTDLMRFSKERPYKCSYCLKAFKQASHRIIHERIHTGERPYQCNYCPKLFYDKCDRRKHERMHTNERPYKCNYCTKAFSQHGDKIRHERTHLGIKAYKCRFCNVGFSQKYSMMRHEAAFHKKGSFLERKRQQYMSKQCYDTYVDNRFHMNQRMAANRRYPMPPSSVGRPDPIVSSQRGLQEVREPRSRMKETPLSTQTPRVDVGSLPGGLMIPTEPSEPRTPSPRLNLLGPPSGQEGSRGLPIIIRGQPATSKAMAVNDFSFRSQPIAIRDIVGRSQPIISHDPMRVQPMMMMGDISAGQAMTSSAESARLFVSNLSRQFYAREVERLGCVVPQRLQVIPENIRKKLFPAQRKLLLPDNHSSPKKQS